MTFAEEYAERFSVWSDVQGHLPFLYEHAALPRGITSRGGDSKGESIPWGKRKVILELGVRGGISTSALLAGVEKSGGHLWSVDVEEPQVPAAAWW